MTTEDQPFALPAAAHVGRVALRVGSLDDLLSFYREAVGCRVDRDGRTARLETPDDDVLLCLEAAPETPERPDDAAGLFHVAIRVPDRAALADALDRLRGAGASLTGASDHLVSEALYLRDPEGNGVEIYRDRPREEWSRTDDGGVGIDTLPLDLDDLAASGTGTSADGLPAGTDVGHVHLEVTDLARSESFYADALGLGVRARYGDDAAFLAAGDYHHHVGLNVWNRRRAPASGRGLAWFEFVLPDGECRETVRRRLADQGHDPAERDGVLAATDPDGIEIRFPVA